VTTTGQPHWNAGLGIEYPGERARPAIENFRAQNALGQNNQGFDLFEICSDERQSFLPRTSFCDEEPFHGILPPWQASKTIYSLCRVSDQTTVQEYPCSFVQQNG